MVKFRKITDSFGLLAAIVVIPLLLAISGCGGAGEKGDTGPAGPAITEYRAPVGYISGLADISGGTIYEATIDVPKQANDSLVYCASGQTDTDFVNFSMSTTPFIDVIAKSAITDSAKIDATGADNKRIYLTDFRSDTDFQWSHGSVSPDGTKIYVTANETTSGTRTGEFTAYQINYSDVSGRSKATFDSSGRQTVTVTSISESQLVTPNTSATIAFRASYTPDGTKILQAGVDRFVVLDSSDLSVLANDNTIGGALASGRDGADYQNHDAVSTPDGNYAILSMRGFNQLGNSLWDGNIQLYNLTTYAEIGEPTSVCNKCHVDQLSLSVTTSRQICGIDADLTKTGVASAALGSSSTYAVDNTTYSEDVTFDIGNNYSAPANIVGSPTTADLIYTTDAAIIAAGSGLGTVQTPAQIAQTSDTDYNNNQNGLITHATLKAWAADWATSKAALNTPLTGNLIVLQVGAGGTGREYIQDDSADGVYVYSVSSYAETRNNGLFDVPSMVLSAASMETFIDLYSIDVVNDMVVIAMGTGSNFGVMNMGRVWFLFRYWGMASTNLSILNGGLDITSTFADADLTATATTASSTDNSSLDDISGVDNTALSVTHGQMMDVVDGTDTTDAVIWDVRSLSEYDGTRTGNSEAFQGHIKGAVLLPYTGVLNPDYTFKSKEALTSLLATPAASDGTGGIGYKGGQTVISHCRTSWRAGASLITTAVILGYPTRLYDGAWAEWGRAAGEVEGYSGTVYGASTNGSHISVIPVTITPGTTPYITTGTLTRKKLATTGTYNVHNVRMDKTADKLYYSLISVP